MKLVTVAWLMILCGTWADAPGADGAASQPAVGAKVDRLIEQLGDADFHVRTAAFKRLKAIGRPARGQLKAARDNSKDAEIVYRCKQLLAVFQTLDTGEECIRTHPAVAEQLKKIARTHPGIPAGLGGSADEQLLALGELSRLKITVEIFDIIEYWATRIKDETVRGRAGYMYASCAARKETIAILAKRADRRRRLIKFVFTNNSGWDGRQPGSQMYIAGKLLVFDESMPLFVKRLMQLRQDAEADPDDLCRWIPIVVGQPAKLHRQLVPIVAAFLDDKRTIEQRRRRGQAHTAQVADYALFALHRMMGKKWAVGLPKTPVSYGALTFETDAPRQKYITAFRAWYKKNRDQFGPDPTTRPATQPAPKPKAQQ